MLSFRDVRLLYLRELRGALRERTIVVNSFLLPLFMYPVLLWFMFSAMTFVQGQEEEFVSRIGLVDLPAAHQALRQELEENEAVELLVLAPEPSAHEQIRGGELDALGELLPAGQDGQALALNFKLRITYDASKDRSDKARERLAQAVRDYRRDWIERQARDLGLGDEDWERFRIERRNVASGKEVGAFLLGLLVPILIIIMVAVGCFYPAVDTTAGERERATWETLMSVAASRTSIVVAKYLYVATLGCTAGLLNLLAMTLSMRAILQPMLGERGTDLEFQVPLLALPLMALAAVLLAMFVAAGMMLLASFARTFREGQSMVGPFYMLTILPPLFVQSPDLVLTPKLALIPIANIALLFRGALTGQLNWPGVGVTLAVEAALVVLCLWLARLVLGFEDYLIGSYSGSLVKFVKERLFRSKGRVKEEAGELR